MWHFNNWHIATWFCLLHLLYQNICHTYNQHAGTNPSSHKFLLMVSPSKNNNLVDSLEYSDPNFSGIPFLFCGSRQSYRIRRTLPFSLPPVKMLLGIDPWSLDSQWLRVGKCLTTLESHCIFVLVLVLWSCSQISCNLATWFVKEPRNVNCWVFFT